MNDWLKIKIIRDIGKPLTNYSKRYSDLLLLIRNTISKQNYTILTNKIKLADLKNIDLDFLEQVTNFKNIEIVSLPSFIKCYVINNSLQSKTIQVSSITIDTIQYLRNNNSHFFYIYYIDKYSARWYEDKDEEYLKKVRKEKLKKIRKEKLNKIDKINI